MFLGRQVPIWHTLTEGERRECGEVVEGVRDRATKACARIIIAIEVEDRHGIMSTVEVIIIVGVFSSIDIVGEVGTVVFDIWRRSTNDTLPTAATRTACSVRFPSNQALRIIVECCLSTRAQTLACRSIERCEWI
eukprot:SAG31_NODE_512_length_14721_cov_17.995623_7_plen_135_part_00